MLRVRLLLVTALLLYASCSQPTSQATEEDSLSQRLPRIAPLEPAKALSSFEVLPGFQLQQVASEPLVHSPVAMAFDENGRLFVVEMCDYSEQDKEFLGKVSLLEDVDGDGRFDRSTVYVDQLSWPTAVICYDGGIFIGAAPDIIYCKDTDGDGKADERNVVFTGFGRSNVQGLLNSFQWGLDNRIYGAASSNASQIRCTARDDRPIVDCRGRDFSFDPRTLEFRAESGGAQHGSTFDDWGRRFVCHNSDHLQMIMFDDRYAARNDAVTMPPSRLSIAADGPQAEVFRISEVEPWRIERTKMRVSGKATGAVEAGGRASGYFTSATGVTVYRGDAFPEECRGQVFVGDVGSNIIHRKTLEDNGVALVGKRIDEGREIVASRDTWFRPAQYANAPDGTLYIADVYREVIEHPKSIPPEIKQHLDLTSGRDRGRIYRLVPDGFQQPPLRTLGKATTAELVGMLADRNGWHRDTAARLLYERHDKSAIPELAEMVRKSPSAEGRMHAMYALASLGALDDKLVLVGLNDAHARVREHAVRLAEPLAAKSPAVREKLCAMTDDADTRVRYQLAFTLGELEVGERIAPLADLARRDAGDRWIAAAVLNSLPDGGAQVLAKLTQDQTFCDSAAGRQLIERMAKIVGARANEQDLNLVESTLEPLLKQQPATAAAIVRGLASGAQGNRRQRALPPKIEALLAEALRRSREVAADQQQPLDTRLDAIATLKLGKFDDSYDVCGSLLDSRQPQEVQSATVRMLSAFADKRVPALLVGAWAGLGPTARTATIDVLFSRPKWILAMLEAVDAGEIPGNAIDASHVTILESHKSNDIRKRAERFLATHRNSARQGVVDAYRAALEQPGDATRGKEAFKRVCSSCHRLEDVGHEIGPPLGNVASRGREWILLNVLDPNREVNPQYESWVVVTKDDRLITGMITSESGSGIRLWRSPEAIDEISRADIEEKHSTGRSIMPEGLERELDVATMTDLLAYLGSLATKAPASSTTKSTPSQPAPSK